MSLISEIWNCIREHFRGGLRDSPYLRLPASFPLPYIDRNNMGGVCWLRLQRSKEHQVVVAIATDLTHRLHLESTVTNSIEIVATEIVDRFGLFSSELVLIEHYDKSGLPYSLRLGGSSEYFHRVELKWDKRNKEFCSPHWVPMSRQEVKSLIGTSLQDIWLERILWTDWDQAPLVCLEEERAVQ